jgi:hypothetical protein
MQVSQSFRGFVSPYAEVHDLEVNYITSPMPRNANVQFFNLTEPTSILELDFLPPAHNWVEVWLDGFRQVNTTFDFGKTYSIYQVRRHRIFFNEPVVGKVKVVCDTFFGDELDPANYVHIKNEQGIENKVPAPGQVFVAQNCEPIIVGAPRHGFARVTDDRKSMVYVPDLNFFGYDSFSYVVMAERGQLSAPKCVYVTIVGPEPKPEEGDPTTPPIPE